MKKFDLYAALNGEPVMLRSGRKAYVVGKIPSNLTYPDNELLNYPLIGVILNKNGCLTGVEVRWTINGKVFEDGKMHDADIICMWEEPKISIEDLPKSFQPKKGEIYYYIHPHETNFYLTVHETTFNDCRFDEILSDTGNCFRTRKDANKWIDFMESMKE